MYLRDLGLDNSLVRTIVLGENMVSVVPLRESDVATLKRWADEVTVDGRIKKGPATGKQLVVRDTGWLSIVQ